jgi:flavin-dependent dehydrogenase
VVAGEFGKNPDGTPGPAYEPGMELHGKYVFLSEGVRGSLSKEVIAKYDLAQGQEPQKFGIGMKEIWEIDPEKHKRRHRHPHDGLAAGQECRAAGRSSTTSTTTRSMSASWCT